MGFNSAFKGLRKERVINAKPEDEWEPANKMAHPDTQYKCFKFWDRTFNNCGQQLNR